MTNLLKALSGNNVYTVKASYYFSVEETTVRISNHLPKRYNWDENNGTNRGVFVFINDNNDLTDSIIESYMEAEFSDIEYSVFLFETEVEAMEQVTRIINQI